MASFPDNQLQLKLQQQQQSIPFRNFALVDGQISAPISFFNAANSTEQSQPSFVHVKGLAPGPIPAADGGSFGWEPHRKRLNEQDLLENSQLTSVDLLRSGSVSTGLGLSLDDSRVEASSGNSPLHLLPMINSDIGRELQRLDAEMDRFIRIQGERLRQSILENVHAKQLQTLASVEEVVLGKIREKESELDDINKRNTELEELIKQFSVEAGMWQRRAKYNENLIANLKFNLQQVYAQGRRPDVKEGCGDSEVDDNASCCNGGGPIDFQLLWRTENMKGTKELMGCKVCGINEACMLLLPCRHLCLCKDCESKFSFCPLCQSSKFIGVEVYL